MQETQVQSLSGEDPLEKEIATHSSILTWKNPMDRGAWWVIVQGIAKIQTQLNTHTHIEHLHIIWYRAFTQIEVKKDGRWKFSLCLDLTPSYILSILLLHCIAI